MTRKLTKKFNNANRPAFCLTADCRGHFIFSQEGCKAPSVYSHRNRYMVEHADRVSAVYNGREKGGTARTIRFADQMKKELREIPVGEIHLPKK